MLLLLDGKEGQIYGCRAGGGRAACAAACRCGRVGAFRRVRSPGWRACWSRRHARGVSGLVCCARNAACAVRCSARARLSLGERWAQGRQWACATRGPGSRASEHGAAWRGAESCAIRVSANAEKSFLNVLGVHVVTVLTVTAKNENAISSALYISCIGTTALALLLHMYA
jgi:hypothetical protein